MPMEDTIVNMYDTLQESLDTVVSARSSTSARLRALGNLERLTARVFASPDNSLALREFLSLQDTFECNVPSRILSWISGASFRLDSLLQRGLSEGDRRAEVTTLASQLTQALSVVQGVALTHQSTKAFLGRRYPLDVLLDLLVISRNLASPSSSSRSTASNDTGVSEDKAVPSPSTLPNAVLDTLLCILVDSSPALRVFEDCNGVQTVVKLLKRAHTPRDVRMKCLEFLYFYLMDETSPRSDLSEDNPEPGYLPPMPLSPSPFIESHSKSRHFPPSSRNASSGSEDSYTSSSSSRSSSSSFSSSTSVSSSSTSGLVDFPTKKEVDFTPLTPKKSHVSRLGLDPLRISSTPGSPFKNFRINHESIAVSNSGARSGSDGVAIGGERDDASPRSNIQDAIKTTEQKKEFLGTMLGNVSALVEGVKMAGVWGLA
ncbi:cell division protein Cdc14 [Gloeopeniophorella convolvens]|nr:cell division protein Cdc14 [Gloeopeniophorella convolvens]